MDNISVSLTAIVLLLVINGFFVAAEFALVKIKSVRLDQLAAQGGKTAVLTQRIHRNLEAYLAACQLGITMASLGLGWVGEPAVAALLEPAFTAMGMPKELLHTTAFIVGFLIFSSLHIVIGEQVPKTFAIRKPEPVSLWVAYPLHAFYLMAWPLNRLLSMSTSAILRAFGVAEASHAEVMTGDELRDLIGVSEEHGHLATNKAEMLHNLFEFDERTVEGVMVSRKEIDLLDLKKTSELNLELIKRTGHSRFPVIDGDNDELLGIILAKDLFNAVLAGVEQPWTHLQDYIRTTLVVPETLSVARLFDDMRDQQAHMAIVVDEYGAFAGLVTMEDLLEEIVGEIADELDEQTCEYPIEQVGNNIWEAHGLLSLTDLEKQLGIDIPDGTDANTLSGLFMLQLERLPQQGDHIRFLGFDLEVLEVRHHRVEKTRISLINDTDEDVADEKHQNNLPAMNGD